MITDKYKERINRFFGVVLAHRVFAGMVLCTLALLFSSSPISANDKNLVRLYVDGNTRTYSTSAVSVEDFLNDVGVDLAQTDAVEPEINSNIYGPIFNVNIYRGRPVVVVDGDFRQTITTAAQSPREIAKQAGLEIKDEDKLELDRITDILAEGALGLKVVVSRATPYNLELFGETNQIYSHAKTVSDVLADKGISLEQGDSVSPGLDDSLVAGATIAVSTVRTEKVTVTEDVNFSTRRISDSQLEVGKSEVETPGTIGQAEVVYEITKTNGVETGRREVSRLVLKEPTEQVLIVGSKPLASVLVSGTKQDWLLASGIPETEWTYVDYIISRESSWNPNARNPSSGAGGLPQALPYSKTGCAWGDPVCQLRWANSYAMGRYGSWAAAYNFWTINHWW